MEEKKNEFLDEVNENQETNETSEAEPDELPTTKELKEDSQKEVSIETQVEDESETCGEELDNALDGTEDVALNVAEEGNIEDISVKDEPANTEESTTEKNTEESSEADNAPIDELVLKDNTDSNVEQIVEEKTGIEKEIKATQNTPKKAIIIGAIATAIVAITLLLIFVVFKHEHTWTERTCTQGSYCTECGEIQFELGYGHNYGEWAIVSNPTCINEGVKERYCSCGEKQTSVIGIVNHTFSEWNIINESTCTQNGKQERVCTLCNKKEEKTLTASHNYVKGVCSKCNDCLISITLPSTPLTVSKKTPGYGTRLTSIKITSIRIELEQKNDGTYLATFYYSGEKTYDYDGTNSTSRCVLVYKLYDSQGYLITSSNDSVNGLCVGEKFKNEYFMIGNLDPNESYRLVITDEQ